MHSAPAVSYPVGRCHIQAWLSACVWGLGALVCAGWISANGRLDWPQGAALLAWGLGGVLAWYDWRQTPSGTLRWDGQQWACLSHDSSQAGTVSPALDWQSGVLVAFHPMGGRRQWLWLVRTADPVRWQAVRRALHGRVASVAAQASAHAEPDGPVQQGAA